MGDKEWTGTAATFTDVKKFYDTTKTWVSNTTNWTLPHQYTATSNAAFPSSSLLLWPPTWATWAVCHPSASFVGVFGQDLPSRFEDRDLLDQIVYGDETGRVEIVWL